METPGRTWVDDSWKQNARAKKIFWKGGSKTKTISFEVLKDKNRHSQSDKFRRYDRPLAGDRFGSVSKNVIRDWRGSSSVC